MTVAEVPPASAVSFDKYKKKRRPDDYGGGASGQRRHVWQKSVAQKLEVHRYKQMQQYIQCNMAGDMYQSI